MEAVEVKMNLKLLVESNEYIKNNLFSASEEILAALFEDSIYLVSYLSKLDFNMSINLLLTDAKSSLNDCLDFFQSNSNTIKIYNILNNQYSSILENLIKETESFFQANSKKNKVGIYGIDNSLSKILPLLMDLVSNEVVCYVEDKPTITSYENKPLIALADLSHTTCDYLVITKNISNELLWTIESGIIDIKNIFDLQTFLTFFWNKIYDYEMFTNYKEYYSTNELEGIITGISYHLVGINPDFLSKKMVNLAVSSQDLFFNYCTAKNVIESYAVNKTIKHCIIGLSYYSFQYDLSQSIYKSKTYNHYPFFRNLHNLGDNKEADWFKQQYHRFEPITQKLLSKNYMFLLHELRKESFDKERLALVSGSIDEEKKKYGKMLAEHDSNRKFPLTVEENIGILKNYLELLHSNNIKPIILICPKTRYYKEYFSEHRIDEFYGIINKFRGNYKMEVIDLYDSDMFDDNDYYDAIHLNARGAEKLTRHLDEYLGFS